MNLEFCHPEGDRPVGEILHLQTTPTDISYSPFHQILK